MGADSDTRESGVRLGLAAAIAVALTACGAEDPPGSDEANPGGFGALEGDRIAEVWEPLSLAQPAPSPADVYLEDITTGGSGCSDPGDVSTSLSEDRKSILTSFDKMVLEYPPPPRSKSLNCVVGFKLHLPEGLQVSLAAATTRLYAYLSAGGRARAMSSYFFAGVQLTPTSRIDRRGPLDDLSDDTVTFTPQIWSRCGESVMFGVNTSIHLNMVGAPDGTAYVNAQTADGAYRKLFHFQWRTCE